MDLTISPSPVDIERPLITRGACNMTTFRAHIVRSSALDLAHLAYPWKRLIQNGVHAEPFFQPYWITSFAHTFAASSAITTLTVHSESELKGVLPFMRRNHFFGGIPARTLSSLSGIHSCRFDFVVDQRDLKNVVATAWKGLKENGSWDVIEALNISYGGAFEALMLEAQNDGYLVARWPTLLTPYLRLPAKGEDPQKNSPEKYKHTRSRLKNYYKKLERLGTPTFSVTTAFTEEWFERFLEMEQTGWKGARGSAIACDPTVKDFYRRALSQAAAAKQLRVYSLEVGDELVAMEIGLTVNGQRYYSPKVSYNERFAKYSPGQLLTRYIVNDLVQEGFELYDFLGPRARHKCVWASDIRKHANCFIFRPSVAGRMRYALIAKIAPAVRKLKYRLWGDPQQIS